MNLYKKLFARKAQEIVKEVESAEQQLEKAQEKLNTLRNGRKADLIKIELLKLISDYAHEYAMHRGTRPWSHLCHDCLDSCGSCEQDKTVEKLKFEIETAIDELMAATPNEFRLKPEQYVRGL